MIYNWIILLYLTFSLIVGSLGHSRKIGFGGAFLISIFLTPLIGLIAVSLFGAKENLTDVKIAHDAGVITDEEYRGKVEKAVQLEEGYQKRRQGCIVFGIIVATIFIILYFMAITA